MSDHAPYAKHCIDCGAPVVTRYAVRCRSCACKKRATTTPMPKAVNLLSPYTIDFDYPRFAEVCHGLGISLRRLSILCGRSEQYFANAGQRGRIDYTVLYAACDILRDVKARQKRRAVA